MMIFSFHHHGLAHTIADSPLLFGRVELFTNHSGDDHALLQLTDR